MTKKMEEFIEPPWDPNRCSQIPIEKFDENSFSCFRKYLTEHLLLTYEWPKDSQEKYLKELVFWHWKGYLKEQLLEFSVDISFNNFVIDQWTVPMSERFLWTIFLVFLSFWCVCVTRTSVWKILGGQFFLSFYHFDEWVVPVSFYVIFLYDPYQCLKDSRGQFFLYESYQCLKGSQIVHENFSWTIFLI